MAHLLNSVFRRLPAAAWVVAISLAQAGCHSAKQQTNQAGVAPPADLEAINELHRRDMQASKTWDVETLASLWTDDIVSIPQDGQPLIGKEANRNSLLKLKDESRDIDIVEYNLAFNEVKVIGEWAFEWGTFSATIKSKDEGEVSRSSGKLFRVLKRDADGSWKVARSMSNNDFADDGGGDSSE
jgi:uncharacterized protein (TIGR02246 family)